MKILIVTPYGEYNYGNKFQNYALQTVLKKHGHSVSTIKNANWYTGKIESSQNIMLKIKIKIWNLIYARKRKRKFQDFSKRYINTCYFNKMIRYDAVCIGSDQIWNPEFCDKFYYTYGMFAKNVFSYAPSFGMNYIDEIYKEKIKRGLMNIKELSVREERGADIVEELIGVRPIVLVDPTMLLTSQEWDEISKKPNKMPKRKYVFTYFLGKQSEKTKNEIENFAKKNKLEIVEIKGNAQFYEIGPSEFIYLLKYSSFVFTDSFHGCVFSILYKKDFFVTPRNDSNKQMTSRIDTLLKKFGLEKRFLKEEMPKTTKCNYANTEEILEKEREKSRMYIEKWEIK